MKTKKTTPPVRISTNRSLAHQRSLLVLFMLACLALLPIARGQDGAVGPAANGNTAEGTNALHSLTGKATGTKNTAVGFDALFCNTNGIENTATGYQALFSNIAYGKLAEGSFVLSSITMGSNITA